jgi:hypothetical protein
MVYDLHVQDHGSVKVLSDLTRTGRNWISEQCPDGQRFGNGVGIEIGYISEVLSGALADDMKITKDGMELYEGDDGEFYLRKPKD